LPVYPLEGIEKRFFLRQGGFTRRASTLVEGFAMPIEHTALHPASGSGYGLTGGNTFSSPDLSGPPVLTRTDRKHQFSIWDKGCPCERSCSATITRCVGAGQPSLRQRPASTNLGVRVNYCYACENAEGFRLLPGREAAGSKSRRDYRATGMPLWKRR